MPQGEPQILRDVDVDAEKKIKDVKSIDFENEAEYQRQLELIRYKRDIAEQN